MSEPYLPDELEVFLYPVTNLKQAIAAGLIVFFASEERQFPSDGDGWIALCEAASEEATAVAMDFLTSDESVNQAVHAQVGRLFVEDNKSNDDTLVDVRMEMTRSGIMAAAGLTPTVEQEQTKGGVPPEDPDDSESIVKGG